MKNKWSAFLSLSLPDFQVLEKKAIQTMFKK